ATVESLFYGCLPLSHNSGGQKEIIGEDKFLYTSIEDAQIKLRWLISMVYSDANKIREQFFKKSQRFTLEKFIDEFYSILKTVNF
ncbi:MAG: hypothetical protein QQN54_05325, partial [Nitrosopumilus sp.]